MEKLYYLINEELSITPQKIATFYLNYKCNYFFSFSAFKTYCYLITSVILCNTKCKPSLKSLLEHLKLLLIIFPTIDKMLQWIRLCIYYFLWEFSSFLYLLTEYKILKWSVL